MGLSCQEKNEEVDMISANVLKCGFVQEDDRGYVLYDLKGNKIQ